MKHIHVEKKNDYAIVRLNRGRANPIDLEMIEELREVIRDLRTDDQIRGAILTGNTPGYFSVGLDIKTIYYYGKEEIPKFWMSWNAMVLEMTKFEKPMIAAVNGHSPAGGCVLSITCDYRLMAQDEKYKIGLNEVAVGIIVPEYIFQLCSFWIGKRKAYQNLMAGRLMSPVEALDCNLVDEICSMDDLLSTAESRLQALLLLPDSVLQQSKKNMRAEMIDRWESQPGENVEERLKTWFDPASRAQMKMVVDMLSNK